MGTMDAGNGSDDGSADCQKKVRELSIKFLDYLSAVARDVTSRPQRDYRREQQALLWDERVTPSAYALWALRSEYNELYQPNVLLMHYS